MNKSAMYYYEKYKTYLQQEEELKKRWKELSNRVVETGDSMLYEESQEVWEAFKEAERTTDVLARMVIEYAFEKGEAD